jgi:hypothetical protein
MISKKIHIICILLLSTQGLTAQDTMSTAQRCPKHFLNPSIHFGTLFGGQLNRGGFDYKSGFGAYITMDGAKNERLQIGIGAGIERLPREWFFPVYLQLISSLKNQTTGGYFILQAGYSFSILEAYNHYHSVNDRGGYMISPGWGYKIQLDKKAQLYFAAQIKQQGLSIDFTSEASEHYTEQFTYTLLMLRVGLRL